MNVLRISVLGAFDSYYCIVFMYCIYTVLIVIIYDNKYREYIYTYNLRINIVEKIGLQNAHYYILGCELAFSLVKTCHMTSQYFQIFHER